MYRSPLHSLLMYQFIDSFLSDLGESKGKKGTQRGVSQGAPVPIWCPPPEGHFKVNVDGVVAKTANRRAVGAVCRSHDGDYLGASPILGSSMRAEKRLLFLLIYRLARQWLPRIVWMCLRDCRRRPWGSTAMSCMRSRTRLCRAGVWCFVMRALSYMVKLITWSA
jgi:hypothetical protein